MLSARCKLCNRELTSTSKFNSVDAQNQMSVIDDHVGANDLGQLFLRNMKILNIKNSNKDDLKYQEERRKHKVRKLNLKNDNDQSSAIPLLLTHQQSFSIMIDVSRLLVMVLHVIPNN